MTASTKPCPIAWTKEDGPCPCAFKDRRMNCESQCECIEMYEERYRQDLLDATTLVITSCPQCGKPTSNTKGDLKKGWKLLCRDCSKEYAEGQALAAHVRGDI